MTWIKVGAAPVLIALIALVEIARFVSFYRLVTFCLAFLLVADLASLARGRLRFALVAVASFAFALCALELTALLSREKFILNVTPGWSVYEPVLGWGAEHPGVYHAERIDAKSGKPLYAVDYTFDSHLLRKTVSSDSGRPIVFFGDSYTFGIGLNDADALPQLFADATQRKERILNLAIGGFSPQQFLRALETGFHDKAIGSDPKLFIFLSAAWQAEQTACKSSWAVNAPRYALEDGALVFKGRCYEGLRRQAQQFLWDSAAYQRFVEPHRLTITRSEVELYLDELIAAVKLAREKYHVATLVPYLRSVKGTLDATGFTDDEIMARLREGGATVIDVSLIREGTRGTALEIPGEGHPTRLANEMRAELIRDYIAEHMSGVLMSQLE